MAPGDHQKASHGHPEASIGHPEASIGHPEALIGQPEAPDGSLKFRGGFPDGSDGLKDNMTCYIKQELKNLGLSFNQGLLINLALH